MEESEENSSGNSNGAKTGISSLQGGKYNSHREVRDSFKKLGSWREDSQRELSKISFCIDQGINGLIEEVCGLRAEIVVTTKERNDLKQTIGNLRAEIRKMNTKSFATQLLAKSLDIHIEDTIKEECLEMDITDTDQQYLELSKNEQIL